MRNLLCVLLVILLSGLGWYLMAEGAAPVTGSVEVPLDGPDRPAFDDRADDRRPGPRQPVAAPEVGQDPAGAGDPSVAGPGQAGPTADAGALDLRLVWEVDGQPAPGVRVLVSTRAVGWDPEREVVTDEDGRAWITGLPAGGVFVRALRGGERSFMVRPGATTTGTLAVPAGVRVAVEVVDAQGAAVPAATVWLSQRWHDNRGRAVGVTDDAGRFELEHVSPHCSLAVRCPGFEPSRLHRVRGVPGGVVRVRVDLRRGGGMIAGVVVDPLGNPVPEAVVLVGVEKPAYAHRAADGTWTPGSPPVARVTDAGGRFEARAVPSGRSRVQVRHPDFAPWEGGFDATPGAPVLQRITLQPGAVLFGRVGDVDGRPIAHARVAFGTPGAFASRMTFADRSGQYELRGLPAGELVVRAEKNRQTVDAALRIAAGARQEWNPVLEPAGAGAGGKVLSGRVVDHLDRPLAGWRVAARAQATGGETVSVSTDGGGRFVLAVKWDELRVWTHAPGEHRGYPPLVRDGVRLADGELLLRVEEWTRRSAEVRGTVVDQAGRPVQAQVQVWHGGIAMWRTFETDAATGGFLIRNLAPGQVEFKVVSQAHAWRRLPPRSVSVGQSVDLGRITLQSGSRIVGDLQPVAGALPDNLRVAIYDADGDEASVAQCVEGGYRTGILVPGSYWLVVMGDRIATARHQIEITGPRDVHHDFELEPAALRILRFELAEGAVRPRIMSIIVRRTKDRSVVWNGGITADGDLRSEVSVPPGEYDLTVVGPGGVTWLRTAFSVADLRDAPVQTFVLRPR